MLADLPAYTDFTPPVVTVRLSYTSRKSLRFEGVNATIAMNEPGTFTVVVRDPSKRQISAGPTANASLPNGGEATVAVKFTQGAKNKLRRGQKIRWTVIAEGLDAVGNRTVRDAKLWIG